MPNRCYDTVEMTGPKESIDKIKQYLVKESEDKEACTAYYSFFRNFAPTPKELEVFQSPATPQFGEDKRMFNARVKRCNKLYGAPTWYERNYINR